MALATIKKITRRMREIWAETAPPAPCRPSVRQRARVTGRLCRRNARELFNRLIELMNERHRIIALGCKEVKYLDGAALAVIIDVARKCKRVGIRLRLLEPSVEVCETFRLYGLEEVLGTLAEWPDLDEGVVIVLEEEDDEMIQLPTMVVEDIEFPNSIRLPALKMAA
ncbi:MAG: STAS domain-containing protein [Planctomycetota bacterium]